ncbi:MAG TPA: tetratricopeptide repeat protein [Vicinamibacterales bacterium]|nr:tetratricopeptide repeat protein [Vicinamibacterales bacterium]
MRRVVALIALVALGSALAYGWVVTRRERTYRAQIQAGEDALARGELVAAIEAFSGAITLRGDSMVAYLRRGEAYRRRQELDAALRDLRRAADLDPAAPRPRELLGDVNLALGRFASAAEQFGESAALDDQSPRVLYKLGLARFRTGQHAACIEAQRRSLALDERFPEAHYLLGLCLREAQKTDEALASLQRSVALAPALLTAREELADLYGRLGRHEARLEQLEVLRALDPGPSREVALGLAYARLGDAESAVTTLGRTARRFPEHRDTYRALGRVWLDAAESRQDGAALGKALAALRAAARAEEDSEVLTQLGRALLLVPDAIEAEAMLRRASEMKPVDPLAFFLLAEAAERRGRAAVARQALLDYRALAGEERDARRRAAMAARIADLSLRANDPSAAVGWYQRALSAGGADPDLLVRLAESQLRAGHRAAARATLDRALQKDPEHAAGLALLRRLS